MRRAQRRRGPLGAQNRGPRLATRARQVWRSRIPFAIPGAALVLAALVGCQSVPVRGDFCHRNSPIRLSADQVDALTDDQVARILAINERGRKLCGWRP